MAKRLKLTEAFKAKVALEALRGDWTIQEIAAKHQLHPNQVSQRKRRVMNRLNGVFEDTPGREANHEAEKFELHATIGRLVVANTSLLRGLGR